MSLTGVNQKWQRRLATGVVETAFSFAIWDEHASRGSGLDKKAMYPQLRSLFLANVAVLRARFPYAYPMVSGRPAFELPEKSLRVEALDERLLTRYPHARLKFDYFSPSRVPRSDQVSYILSFGRQDVSDLSVELLGLSPPPLYAALLLSNQDQLHEWISVVTSQAASSEQWESLILDRLGALVWVHEGVIMFVKTKDPKLVEFLRAG